MRNLYVTQVILVISWLVVSSCSFYSMLTDGEDHTTWYYAIVLIALTGAILELMTLIKQAY